MFERARHLDDAIELIHEFFRRHSRPPLLARLNWIVVSNISSGAGSSRSPRPGLAEHARDLGHGLDQRSVAAGASAAFPAKVRAMRRHVEQVASSSGGMEFAAEPLAGQNVTARIVTAASKTVFGRRSAPSSSGRLERDEENG